MKMMLFYGKLKSFKYYMYIHFVYFGSLSFSFYRRNVHASCVMTATFHVKIMLDSAIYKI